MRAFCILAIGFFTMGAVACSGSTETGSGGGSSGTGTATGTGTGSSTGSGADVTKACADLVKERCTHSDACSANHGTQTLYGDEATCEARGQISCLSALDAPGTSATAATTEACAMAGASESCADLLDNNPPAACVPSPGKVATGGACGANGQCQSTFCAIAKNAVCGTCAPQPKAGDSCATFACGRNLNCDRTTQICVVPAAAGAACSKDETCAAGLSCVGANAMMMTMGTCQTAGSKAGDMCDPKAQKAPTCDRNLGLYCDPVSKACASVTYVGANQPCGVVAGGFGVCTGGGLCVMPAGAKAGTCSAPAADGAACDAMNGPPCLRPAECVVPAGSTKGVCTLPDAAKCK
jgi:hypothetical protein